MRKRLPRLLAFFAVSGTSAWALVGGRIVWETDPGYARKVAEERAKPLMICFYGEM